MFMNSKKGSKILGIGPRDHLGSDISHIKKVLMILTRKRDIKYINMIKTSNETELDSLVTIELKKLAEIKGKDDDWIGFSDELP